jgi:hypothetical protein
VAEPQAIRQADSAQRQKTAESLGWTLHIHGRKLAHDRIALKRKT